MKYRNNVKGAIALGLSLALAACGEQTAEPSATLALTECRIANIDNAIRCGKLPVWENRATKQGRKLDVFVAVIPATAKAKEPDPVFVLVGGPGQAASDYGREALAMMGGLNNRRDIVLVDQRGTGRTNGLQCKSEDPYEVPSLDAAKRDARGRELMIACRDALSKRADLTQYTTTIAMADLDDVRAALGYKQINLWGGSYGTRAAQEYMRRYPNNVRSVVLDGVAPPSMALPATFARDAGAAYDKLMAACEANTACNKQFPALKTSVDTLLANIDKTPQRINMPDPVTGVSRELTITREAVMGAIFSNLYVPELGAILPNAINAALRNDFAPLMALSATVIDSLDDKIYAGMRMSVVCAEDAPRIPDNAASSPDARAPFGHYFVREFKRACDLWPRGAMAADFATPVNSTVPVLVLSGGLDPVTPPIMGEEIVKTLPKSKHLIAPNVGHGVSSRGCAPQLIRKFVEAADVASIDGACLAKLPRPLFYEPLQRKAAVTDSSSQTKGERS